MRKKLLVLATLLFTLIAVKVTCNAAEMLQTTNFKSGVSAPWNISEVNEMCSWSEIKNGELVVHVDRNGEIRWDVQLRHREISIVKGHKYKVHFKLYAKKTQKIYVKIGDSGEPYNEAWSNNYTAYTIPESNYLDITESFTSIYDCKLAEMSFQFGGVDPYDPNNDCSAPVAQEIHFVEMSLTDDDFVPTPAPTPTPDRLIRVNQLGYYPEAVKRATIATNATSALDVELKDSTGKVVWTGKSQPKSGKDIASGEYIHIVDFSDFKSTGREYQLFAGTLNSVPFDIGNDMYSKMKYDALKYFYYARSGIEIKMPFSVESKWERGAGHPKDIATQYPNKVFYDSVTGKSVPFTGPATIDGTGGWYDSGDYGKYVVNGGLATWILQNQYERALKKGTTAPYEDETMIIPESGNNIPDLLDETRYNIDFFLNVQIKSGDKAGMVIHKLASEKWLALVIKPEDDDLKRYYYPVSTAATLNFAAVTAQASRLWKEYDPEFSKKCLEASEKAWQAALENPNIEAPWGMEQGSCTYGDNQCKDEFYWVACELFITTKNTEYLAYIRSSEYAFKCPLTLEGESNGMPGSMDWGNTSACGTIDLGLLVPEGLTEVEKNTIKTGMAAAADTFLADQAKEGYEVPLAVSTYTIEYGGQREIVQGYPWASNSFILNQSIIFAYAYDLTGEKKYADGVIKSMDYLMGRNPLIKCYVSGYGENPVMYPHHRYFCPQLDPIYPSVPPGFIAGGPFSGAQNPWGMSGPQKTGPAQKCYKDDFEAWGSNEVSLSWNASLAWLTGFVDEVGPGLKDEPTASTIPSVTPSWNEKKCDIDNNGFVNIADIMAVVAVFNTDSTNPRYVKSYDMNDDGAINIADILIMVKYFNKAV